MAVNVQVQGTSVFGGISPILIPSTVATAPSGILQTFSLQNTNVSSASKVKNKIGLPFKKGDMPAGSIPKLSVSGGSQITTVQYDQRVTWSDGSLKYAVCNFTDADIAAGSSRSYEVEAMSGTFANSQTSSWATITANSDINIVIDTLKNVTADTTVGSGTFSASFNDLVNSRKTKIAQGSEVDGWTGWMMLKDQTGGAEDASLKVYWFLDYWRDGTYSFVAMVSQDWLEATSKLRRSYNLTLRDGTTTIETYSNIVHPYHQRWTTVRLNDDDQHGERHWSSNMPTLHYEYDRNYFVETQLIPPLDTTFTPLSEYTSGGDDVYVPLSNIAHSAGIDSTGSYPARGMLSNVDSISFMRNTPADERARRVNGLVGNHLYVHRTNETRDRSSFTGDPINDFTGESSDIASTINCLPLAPKTLQDYDFTARGMPTPKDCYRDDRTSASFIGGYVQSDDGEGFWNLSIDTSHQPAMSYFSYLVDGERYFLEALLDHGIDCAQKYIGGSAISANAMLQGALDAPRATAMSIPSDRWNGIAGLYSGKNSRGIGWSQVCTGTAAALVPDDDVVAPYIKLFNQHQSDYLLASAAYYPQDQLDLGLLNHHKDVPSHWMQDICVMGSAFNDAITESGAFDYAKLAAPRHIYVWGGNRKGFSFAYRISAQEFPGEWEPGVNDYLPFLLTGMVQTNITAGSATISKDLPLGKSATIGDLVYASDIREDAVSFPVPTELSLNTPYYVVNVGSDTFEISDTPGGSAITFSETMLFFLNIDLQADDMTTINENGVNTFVDGTPGMCQAALVMLYKGGAPGITEQMVDDAATFMAPILFQDEWVNWRLVK